MEKEDLEMFWVQLKIIENAVGLDETIIMKTKEALEYYYESCVEDNRPLNIES